jgi:hypothetical protein
MDQPSQHRPPTPIDDRRSSWRSPSTIAMVMVAVVLVFYVLREHWDHLAGRWIYLLLACPLMHLPVHASRARIRRKRRRE